MWPRHASSDGTMIGTAPETWGAVDPKFAEYFVRKMVSKHASLGLCEGGAWKAEKFAIQKYPSMPKKYKAINPAKLSTKTRAAVEQESLSDDPAPGPAFKKQRTSV